ncbi:MAG TPA: histidine kinase [Gemmatimonadales bacterium]
MNSATDGRGHGRLRTTALVLLLCVVALTLLFSAQEVMRRGIAGQPIDWSQTLRFNGLDWVLWGMMTMLIVVIGRRYRLDATGQRVTRVSVWIGMAIAATLAQSLLTGIILRAWGLIAGPPGTAAMPLGRFLVVWTASTVGFNLITFFMIAALLHAALYYGDLRARRLREADLERRLARSELNALRQQLQPHFLFNALHTVSSLMTSNVPSAQRVIADLGDLLRASLDHTAQQEVPLREELDFVRRYLEIQQARFRDRLRVSMSVEAPGEALVPSLLLQPLVDNAIRHGIDGGTGQGTIWISARRDNNRLVLEVRDDGSRAGETPAGATPQPGGIGLENIEKRLVQLYGANRSFQAGRGADGHFAVRISLPLHTDAAQFPSGDSA